MNHHLPRKGLEKFIGVSMFSCIEGFHSNTDKKIILSELCMCSLIFHMNSGSNQHEVRSLA
mgnify:CR=1 FL=1